MQQKRRNSTDIFYAKDLAYIHDAGFRDYSLNASPGLLGVFRRNGVNSGLVVDLGCGSGRWAGELIRHGYDVYGIDRSRAFLTIARRVAPSARFAAGSLWNASLPPCVAVTALGECLNYEPGGDRARLFSRVRNALRPGGVFIFDSAGPDRIAENGAGKLWTEGRDWAVLVEKQGDRRRAVLTRRIICFRKSGGGYRRSEEIHRQALYEPAAVLQELSRAGFEARQVNAYGRFRLPEGISGFIARRVE